MGKVGPFPARGWLTGGFFSLVTQKVHSFATNRGSAFYILRLFRPGVLFFSTSGVVEYQGTAFPERPWQWPSPQDIVFRHGKIFFVGNMAFGGFVIKLVEKAVRTIS